jgi:hypothetical protein
VRLDGRIAAPLKGVKTTATQSAFDAHAAAWRIAVPSSLGRAH